MESEPGRAAVRTMDKQTRKLTRDNIFSLEQYAEARKEFRARVIEHKRDRRLALGTNATLYFEDRLTMQYQVQEMLRIERIFEKDAIEQELAAYNPLIPDGANLKATFMIEVPDPGTRRRELQRLAAAGNRLRPELVPLPAQVGSINDALSVRGAVGAGAPAGFLFLDQCWRRAAVDPVTPDLAGAVRRLRVADDQELAPVGRPGGADLVVKAAVVVTLHRALAFDRQRCRL